MPGVFEPIKILISHQENFYLGSKVLLFRLLLLSSLLEFTVFSDSNLR